MGKCSEILLYIIRITLDVVVILICVFIVMLILN